MAKSVTGKIGGLGEIALRVVDLDAMVDFYANVIGLPIMSLRSDMAFFRIADGFEGHTQILALFDRSQTENYRPPRPGTTSVDHFAFSIALEHFDSESKRLQSLGQEVTFAEHAWVQWRSLYVNDPEGNTVELVCFDPSIPQDR